MVIMTVIIVELRVYWYWNISLR